MPRQKNDDVSLLWLLGGNRQRTYRQIIRDAEAKKNGLVSSKTLQETAKDLADVIRDQGEATEENIGQLEHTMQSTYLAKAELDPSLAQTFGLTWDESTQKYIDNLTGTYYESILAKILYDAEYISEQFTRQETTILQGNIDDLHQAIQETNDLFNGEIRRGFIDFNGERYFGIVIASRNVFSVSGETYTPDGETNPYYQIDTGYCYGLYTATGWQFWRGNQRLGWFDTDDGQLHVNNIAIEDDLTMGNWRMVESSTTFGIKYIGG